MVIERRVLGKRLGSLFMVLVLTLLLLHSTSPVITQAQGASHYFPETGKTVSGKFLDYWNTHGGLAQQGLPISEVIQERSDVDGKNYTVQYFERATFELHPEFAGTPNEVLLQLLGVFYYQQKYSGGPPAQVPNKTAGTVLFSQTGKYVGGLFLDYWKSHGGLAQQGYPISDEFLEQSDLDGQLYKVQYFERAVFEHHPENKAPFDVLLSQLGTFRYKSKYVSPPSTRTPAPASPTVGPSGATPTTRPASTTPVPQPSPTANGLYDGHWHGTNSYGGIIDFGVSNRVVTDFSLEFVARTCPRSVGYEHANIPIVNSSFRFVDDYGDVFTGTFTSNTSATGSLHWPEIPEDPPDCRGTWDLTWSATR